LKIEKDKRQLNCKKEIPLKHVISLYFKLNI